MRNYYLNKFLIGFCLQSLQNHYNSFLGPSPGFEMAKSVERSCIPVPSDFRSYRILKHIIQIQSLVTSLKLTKKHSDKRLKNIRGD
jgi:restriction endonuclease S subunit